MLNSEAQRHMLWEIWFGDLFLGTCTTEGRVPLIEEAITAGLMPRREGIMNYTDQRLIGSFNLLHSKVRSSFVSGDKP